MHWFACHITSVQQAVNVKTSLREVELVTVLTERIGYKSKKAYDFRTQD